MIADIRTALANSLKGIPRLNVSDKAPETVTTPMAFITENRTPSLEYHKTGGLGTIAVHFRVTLLISEALIREAQEQLDQYLLQTGDYSIPAALEATDLTGIADFIVVSGVEDYGRIEYQSIEYLGCRFIVLVYVSPEEV